MNEKTMETIAEEHWEWLEGLWNSFLGEVVFDMSTVEYLYKTAFVHGWKHAQQDRRNNSTTAGEQMDSIKELTECVKKLNDLLQKPEPGLMTWCEFTGKHWKRIADLYYGNEDRTESI